VTYSDKTYGIVIVRPNGDNRLFGRVRRSAHGDVYVVWSEYDSPSTLDRDSNPHASYHRNGRLHSKTYDRPTIVKQLQAPGKAFRGKQPIEATNADRALSATLPAVSGQFADLFEIPSELVTGRQNQAITVDLVEPGVAPVRLTGRDLVLIDKVFQDSEPWIVVSLVEPPKDL
jgi:hypothetical protein